MIEHGVLFHRTPDNAAEQKKTTSVLKYWVIGYVYDIVRKNKYYLNSRKGPSKVLQERILMEVMLTCQA